METSIIILTILGSGAFSAVVTGIMNSINSHRNKSIDFKYNYKNYILEKRKAAYDVIETIFLNERNIFQNSIASNFITTRDLKNRLDILEGLDFKISMSLSFWLSADLINAVSLYYNFVSLLINAIKNAMTEEGYEPDYEIPETAKVGIIAVEKELRSTYWYGVVNAYMNDLIHLDDIDGFKNYIKVTVAENKNTN